MPSAGWLWTAFLALSAACWLFVLKSCPYPQNDTSLLSLASPHRFDGEWRGYLVANHDPKRCAVGALRATIHQGQILLVLEEQATALLGWVSDQGNVVLSSKRSHPYRFAGRILAGNFEGAWSVADDFCQGHWQMSPL